MWRVQQPIQITNPANPWRSVWNPAVQQQRWCREHLQWQPSLQTRFYRRLSASHRQTDPDLWNMPRSHPWACSLWNPCSHRWKIRNQRNLNSNWLSTKSQHFLSIHRRTASLNHRQPRWKRTITTITSQKSQPLYA